MINKIPLNVKYMVVQAKIWLGPPLNLGYVCKKIK